MGKLALLQAVYAVTGIMFFVRDLMVERTPMDKAMINAFIWPYAQFQLMKVHILMWINSALAMIR